MGFLKDFKTFATRGNMMDLAVALVIGAAFGRVITSLVNDLLMPPISLLFGDARFTDRYVVLQGDAPPGATLEAAREAGAIVFAWGSFVTTVIEFIIVALALFVVIRQMVRLQKKQEAAATTKPCPLCLTTVPLEARRCPACTSDLAA